MVVGGWEAEVGRAADEAAALLLPDAGAAAPVGTAVEETDEEHSHEQTNKL